MLTENHPHAWDADYADTYLDPNFRKRRMPDGAKLVVTPEMRHLIDGTYTGLDRCTAAVVSGPYGSGKSTLLAALAAVSDVNTVTVEIPSSANAPKAQWEILTNAITGSAHGTARQLQMAALDYLVQVPTLLIVDEAQHLRASALEQLRWLWTSNIPRFAIVLAGSGLNAKLDKTPAVATRINQRILLNASTPQTMLNRVRAGNPDLAATDPALLELIEEVYGHSSWRNWSEFLIKAHKDFAHTGPLTAELVRHVIHSRTGVPAALEPAGAAGARNR